MQLYELTAEYQQLAESLIGDDGEVSPEAEKTLDALAGEMSGKVDGICKLIQQFQADADVSDYEAKRLRDLSTSREMAATRLKAYLKANLETLGMKRFGTSLFRVRIQKNSRPSIRWTRNVDELPTELKRVTVDFNGQTAYELWKAGVPMPEGVAVEQGSHLRIS